jgi:type IX secretion system PorP/SprF family membrane protein
MKKITLILIVLASKLVAQQDPQYNLYQFNPLIINPAYAGARDGIVGTASIRNQWVGFEGAPKTIAASVHAPVLNRNIGLGLTLCNDVMGPRNLTSAHANFAYILKLNNKYKLSFGLNAGLNRYSFNFNKLTYKQNENIIDFSQVQNFNSFDANSGLYFRSNSFFIGYSNTHLFSKEVYNISTGNNGSVSYRLRTHQFLSIGKSFMFSEKFIFAPTILLKSVNGNGLADVNLNAFLFKKVWFGVFARLGYGPGFLFQYYINNNFKVGYSYDTGLGSARNLGSSHEIVISFEGSTKKSKVISPRFL